MSDGLCRLHLLTCQNANSDVVQVIDAMKPEIQEQLAVQRGNSERMDKFMQEQKRLSKEVQDAADKYVPPACCATMSTSQHDQAILTYK